MKKEQARRLFPLIGAILVTLFLAGVVAPSFLRSETPRQGLSLQGSLQTMRIAGVSFNYKLENILFAVLGVLFGMGTVLVMTSLPSLTRKNKRSSRFARLSLASEMRD